MSFPHWSLLLGALLVGMVLIGTLMHRLPLSTPMVYLLLGYLLGPRVADVLRPDPLLHTVVLYRVSEAALLIALFSAGLKLGAWRKLVQWRVPIRLAVLAMVLMVAAVAAIGVVALHLPLGVAVLLGAILAPTDPVLAAAIAPGDDAQTDHVGFSLAGEGALNDGTAFPFVMLGLGLMGLHDPAGVGASWWLRDVGWSTVAGLAVGGIVGAVTGRLVVYLRSRHGEAVGQDAFLALGVIALTYGAAHMVWASGFLAVLAAGITFRHVRERPQPGSVPLETTVDVEGHAYSVLATHSHHASATMRHSVQGFNEQLENFVELALVLIVGAMLAYVPPEPALMWFIPLLLLVLRPATVVLVTFRCGLSWAQRGLMGWFGIRGIGSLFYVLFCIGEGVPAEMAQPLLSLTLWTVAASIVVHGVTARPLMRLFGAYAT